MFVLPIQQSFKVGPAV